MDISLGWRQDKPSRPESSTLSYQSCPSSNRSQRRRRQPKRAWGRKAVCSCLLSAAPQADGAQTHWEPCWQLFPESLCLLQVGCQFRVQGAHSFVRSKTVFGRDQNQCRQRKRGKRGQKKRKIEETEEVKGRKEGRKREKGMRGGKGKKKKSMVSSPRTWPKCWLKRKNKCKESEPSPAGCILTPPGEGNKSLHKSGGRDKTLNQKVGGLWQNVVLGRAELGCLFFLFFFFVCLFLNFNEHMNHC